MPPITATIATRGSAAPRTRRAETFDFSDGDPSRGVEKDGSGSPGGAGGLVPGGGLLIDVFLNGDAGDLPGRRDEARPPCVEVAPSARRPPDSIAGAPRL